MYCAQAFRWRQSANSMARIGKTQGALPMRAIHAVCRSTPTERLSETMPSLSEAQGALRGTASPHRTAEEGHCAVPGRQAKRRQNASIWACVPPNAQTARWGSAPQRCELKKRYESGRTEVAHASGAIGIAVRVGWAVGAVRAGGMRRYRRGYAAGQASGMSAGR